MQQLPPQVEVPRYRRILDHLGVLSLACMLVLFTLVLACVLIFLLSAQFPFILFMFAMGIGFIPVALMLYATIGLVRYAQKPIVIDVAERGTIIRHVDGNMQVISPSELFAFETRNAVPITVPIPYVETRETPETPETFPENTPFPVFPDGNTTETLPIDDVVSLLNDEERKMKEDTSLIKRELTKQQILRLRECDISLRNIAKYVHMTGRKYSEFKNLCEELGLEQEVEP